MLFPGNKFKWNLETKAWDKVDPKSEPDKPGGDSTKDAAKETESSEESELDSDAEEKMTPEEKRQRAYKKRKVAPGLVSLQTILAI